jgi:hypothetical protein
MQLYASPPSYPSCVQSRHCVTVCNALFSYNTASLHCSIQPSAFQSQATVPLKLLILFIQTSSFHPPITCIKIDSHLSVTYQWRISSVSVTRQSHISDVSVPYQCRPRGVRHRNIVTCTEWSKSQLTESKMPTFSVNWLYANVYFKWNHSHISDALNGQYWYGTDTALIDVNRP